MTDHTVVGLDLRSSDMRLAVLDSNGVAHVRVVPAAAASRDDRVVYGTEAAQLLAADPGAGWTRLLDRVGDPVPCSVGPERITAAELVARTIAASIPPDAAELRCVTAAAWGPAHRSALEHALVAAGLPAPRWIDELAALAPPPAPPGEDPRVLLVTLGSTVSSARVLAADAGGWTPEAAVPVPFGEDDVTDVTFAALSGLATERAGRPLTLAEARALVERSTTAAQDALAGDSLEVDLPGLPSLRLPAAALSATLRRRALAAFAGLPAALAAAGVASLPGRVLLEGAAAHLPVVSAALGETLGSPAIVAGTEVAAVLAGPAFDLAGDAPMPAGPGAPETPVAEGSEWAAGVVLPPVARVAAASPAGDAPPVYRWADDLNEPPRDRRGLKIAGAAAALLLVLGGIGIVAGQAIRDALTAAQRPAAPAAIPAGGNASVASAPAADLPSAPAPLPAPTLVTPSPSASTPATAAPSTRSSSKSTSTTRPRTTTSAPIVPKTTATPAPVAPTTSPTTAAPPPTAPPPPTTTPVPPSETTPAPPPPTSAAPPTTPAKPKK